MPVSTTGAAAFATNIMAAIADGLYQPSMKARMEDLERQKAEITARLAVAPRVLIFS
ncbi:hypothetical protein LB528_27680 [Mesorhizobium sp. CA4]|nr:hypothetical protein [Mesorhizobium sp. CA4]